MGDAPTEKTFPIDMRTDIGALWKNYMVGALLKKKHYALTYAISCFWRTTQQQEIDCIEECNSNKMTAYQFEWNPTIIDTSGYI